MAATVVGLALLAVVAASSVWNAAESHYRACIEERFANGYVEVPSGRIILPGQTPPPGSLTTVSTAGCKRWPF